MKRLSLAYCALLVVGSSLSASAETSVPNCWDNEAVVKQHYILSIKKNWAAQKVVSALEAIAHSSHLSPLEFPLFFDNVIFSTVKANNGYDANSNPLSDADFRKVVEAELSSLQHKHGIKIECNGIFHPMD